MRRLLASCLVAALVGAPGVASSMHVHEYTGHDHPTHHHGPASHEHGHQHPALTASDQDPDTSQDHDTRIDSHAAPTVRDESCDPGRHAVAVKMGCTQPPSLHLDLAELPGPTIAVRPVSLQAVVALTDVRVHGPPFDPRIPPRAPPLPLHA